MVPASIPYWIRGLSLVAVPLSSVVIVFGAFTRVSPWALSGPEQPEGDGPLAADRAQAQECNAAHTLRGPCDGASPIGGVRP